MPSKPESKSNVKIRGTVLRLYESKSYRGGTREYISLMCSSDEFEIPIEYSFRYSSKWKSLNISTGDNIEFLALLKRSNRFSEKGDTTINNWNWPSSDPVKIELQRPKQLRKVNPGDEEPEIIYKTQLTHLLLILLDVAGRDVQYSSDFEEDYRKRLRFQKQTDWKRYRASVDLVEDTEQAILSAFTYQLGDLENRNRDYGETYLRLYGILNAIYLQMNAFKEISNLLNYPERNQVMPVFESLDIYKLLNIAGAHTTDYQYSKQEILELNGVRKTTSFRIIQMHLDKTGKNIQALDENNVMLKFNLLSVLREYESIATKLLVKLILHIKETLLLKQEDKIWMQERLDELLPNLIDYSTVDMNKSYKSNLINRINEDLKADNL